MKSIFVKTCAVILLSCVVGPTFAQMVIQAESVSLQPQIGRDEAGFKTCGIRAVVIAKSGQDYDLYDFSLNIRAEELYGALKAGKSRTTVRAVQQGKASSEVVLPAPVRFWISKEDEGKAITPLKTFPADTKGYIMEVADLSETFKGIVAMIYGERMQFAVRYKNQPLDIVVSFSEKLPEIERAPLMKCLDAVVERTLKMTDKN